MLRNLWYCDQGPAFPCLPHSALKTPLNMNEFILSGNCIQDVSMINFCKPKFICGIKLLPNLVFFLQTAPQIE